MRRWSASQNSRHMKPRKLAPWKVLRIHKTYSAPPYVKVEVHEVQLPDGRVIRDFHRVTMVEYSVAVAQTGDGRFVFERQYKHGIGEVTLTFPAGAIARGESPLAAAQRELLEE